MPVPYVFNCARQTTSTSPASKNICNIFLFLMLKQNSNKNFFIVSTERTFKIIFKTFVISGNILTVGNELRITIRLFSRIL